MTEFEKAPVDAAVTERKAQILDEASRSFNELGYFDTRLEDIAERVGAAKTLISYHFRSKEALLADVYERAIAFSDTELADAARARTGLDRVIAWVRGHAFAHANAAFGRASSLAILSDLQALAPNDHSVLSARHQAQMRAVREFLREGSDDGSVRIRSIDAATFYISSVVHWLPRWLEGVPPQRYDAAIDRLCDTLRFGVLADPDRQSPPTPPAATEEFPAIFDRDTRNRLKREAFLRAGTRLLNRDGFRSLALSDVAAELGVTRGAFYYYISDKEELLELCLDRTCVLIESAIDGLRPNAPDAASILEQALRRLFQLHSTDIDPLVRASLIHALPPVKSRAVQARFKKIAASFAEVLAAGMVDGSVRPTDLDAAEHLLLGVVLAASRRRLALTGLDAMWRPVESPITASASYFQPLLHGLASR